MRLKVSSAKWRPFCLGLNVLNHCHKILPLFQGVVVHCLGGHGRTGTMLACYLVRFLGVSGEEAIEEIRRMRPGSVETVEQEETIKKYADAVAKELVSNWWRDEWMDGWVGGWIERSVEWWMYVHVCMGDGWLDGWRDGYLDGWIVWLVSWMDG